ncbi:glycosyltransferase family 2 protein [uncultured Brachyspira sp.]|uniref:glycosyltransferase family 2 protein n=1 Tax=uncultured Brachyspira sp. TaxID=221953 RepID=UPI00262F1BEE|nr:glycosyltransferase family 2 protein [uncultured Brachyspira sp.]
MNNIKVSVIITAYNMQKFIEQCLETVINQSLRDIEIICIDDCSSDNTYNILQHYKSIDNRITIIKNNTNLGQSRSINLGLDLSKGEYIYLLDSDDYISNNFLYELYNTAIKYNSDITQTSNIVSVFYDDKLGGDYRIEYDNIITNLKNNVLYDKNIIEGDINFSIKNLNIGNYKNIDISPWNKIVKREFILKNNLYFSYIENLKDHINDFNFFYKLLYNNPKASYNHRVEYFHRFRNNSFMGATNNDINRIIAVIERMKDLFDYCYNKNSELVQYITPRIFCGLKYNFDIMDNKKEIYKYIHNIRS